MSALKDAAETRLRLLDAGLDLFGRLGFEATSTRALAERAEVNLGAIPYHFGGKEGLYGAVAEHIASEMRGRFAAKAGDITAVFNRGVTPGEARALLMSVVDRFVDVVVDDQGGERWGPFIIREQMTPTPAFERLYAGFLEPMNILLCRLVAAARGGPRPDDQLRVFTLIGQMLVFRAARATVLRRLGWDGMNAARLAAIKDVLHQNIAAILGGGADS